MQHALNTTTLISASHAHHKQKKNGNFLCMSNLARAAVTDGVWAQGGWTWLLDPGSVEGPCGVCVCVCVCVCVRVCVCESVWAFFDAKQKSNNKQTKEKGETNSTFATHEAWRERRRHLSDSESGSGFRPSCEAGRGNKVRKFVCCGGCCFCCCFGCCLLFVDFYCYYCLKFMCRMWRFRIFISEVQNQQLTTWEKVCILACVSFFHDTVVKIFRLWLCWELPFCCCVQICFPVRVLPFPCFTLHGRGAAIITVCYFLFFFPLFLLKNFLFHVSSVLLSTHRQRVNQRSPVVQCHAIDRQSEAVTVSHAANMAAGTHTLFDASSGWVVWVE